MSLIFLLKKKDDFRYYILILHVMHFSFDHPGDAVKDQSSECYERTKYGQ